MQNQFKLKVAQGLKPIGTFALLGSEVSMEALKLTQVDYVIIDGEHGAFEPETIQNLIRAAQSKSLTSFVRVREISRTAVLKSLDAGAEALIVPCVKTVQEVKKLIEFAKFAPLGERGFGLSRASGYGAYTQDINSYFQKANQETLLIPQCETKEALENIDEIVALEGVDGIFVGPYDLSVSLGIPAQFTSALFQEALQKVIKACKKHNKFSIMFTMQATGVQPALAQGFDSVTLSTDLNMLINAVNQNLEQAIRGAAPYPA